MIFTSDNQSGASQQVLDAIVEANCGATAGYGGDDYTQTAIEALKQVFACDLDVFFVCTGTVSNCLALASLCKPWESILCSQNAHLAHDESTAPEFLTGGARIIPIRHESGKLSAKHINQYLDSVEIDPPHDTPARVVSIAQVNEIGQVYIPEELIAISEVCKKHDMKFHMDGARFANALASQGCTPAELTWKSGVDVLSLGATKCGALCAEAFIFFDRSLAKDFAYHVKRAGQLVSKGRLFGAQFIGWLHNNHWLDLARHANRQAMKLTEALSSIDGVEIIWPIEANQLFMVLPRSVANELKENGVRFNDWHHTALPPSYTITHEQCFVRLVCSYNTNDEDCQSFINTVHSVMHALH